MRRRRHQDTRMLRAVRTTHAAGAGCRLSCGQEAQARAYASATRSSASARSPVPASTARRQLSRDR